MTDAQLSSEGMLLLFYNLVQLINKNKADVNTKLLRARNCSDKLMLLISAGNFKANQ